MADWPPVIDADGHVLERQSDIRKYLEPPWNRRNTGLWPSDQPFDTDLFETGVLDSLKFVELLVQLEQQFGTRVSLDDLELDNFRSIGQIAHFIVGRRGPPGATEQVQG